MGFALFFEVWWIYRVVSRFRSGTLSAGSRPVLIFLLLLGLKFLEILTSQFEELFGLIFSGRNTGSVNLPDDLWIQIVPSLFWLFLFTFASDKIFGNIFAINVRTQRIIIRRLNTVLRTQSVDSLVVLLRIFGKFDYFGVRCWSIDRKSAVNVVF